MARVGAGGTADGAAREGCSERNPRAASSLSSW